METTTFKPAPTIRRVREALDELRTTRNAIPHRILVSRNFRHELRMAEVQLACVCLEPHTTKIEWCNCETCDPNFRLPDGRKIGDLPKEGNFTVCGIPAEVAEGQQEDFILDFSTPAKPAGSA